MKLVINIPCYNEEKTLPLVLLDIPKKIKGIDKIEVQIVDDGSTDRTVEVAQKLGVDRIIRHKKNLGLGTAFKHGVEAALESGADIFVNTDGDNQYPSKYIKDLVKPIITNGTDIVIGDRRPWKVKHFSLLKRFFQYVGNLMMRRIMKSNVPDTVSGFRAYNKEAMLRLNVVTKFSYVLDTIMQASHKGLKIVNFRIKCNPPTRQSRLFSNIFQHMIKSGVNMLRLFYLYEPFKTFLYAMMVPLIPGLFLFFRFFYYFFSPEPRALLQSLIISAVLLICAMLLFGFGIIGDSLKTNRMITEEHLYFKKREVYG